MMKNKWKITLMLSNAVFSGIQPMLQGVKHSWSMRHPKNHSQTCPNLFEKTKQCLSQVSMQEVRPTRQIWILAQEAKKASKNTINSVLLLLKLEKHQIITN